MNDHHVLAACCLATVLAVGCSKSGTPETAVPSDTAARGDGAVATGAGAPLTDPEPNQAGAHETTPSADVSEGAPHEEAEQKPSVVRAHALFTPDPSAIMLAGTQAAIEGKNTHAKVSFCIDVAGHTTDIELTESSADDRVDQIIVDVLKTWRFEPMMRRGKAVKVCTFTVFNLNFE